MHAKPRRSGRMGPGSFEMLTCPYCQQQTLTHLRKSVIGPSWLAIVPIALGALAMFAIHAYWVPLVAQAS